MNDNLLFEDINSFTFTKRPMPVPYNYRIMYKVAQITLIIGICCRKGSSCSLLKLHFISWGLTSKKEMDALAYFANKKKGSVYPYIKFDPALNRALAFAVSEQIILQQSNGKYLLGEKGKKFFDELIENQDLLKIEKNFLASISTKLPENKIHSILGDWRIYT
ncbi:MAG: hypothetical protein VR72_20450 [Clostridiaceae bacterium BRH_c20a]|nr:MAG: hypothetical protein VR72_20450 [Clostridiaceae bacterium BRH_c20a]